MFEAIEKKSTVRQLKKLGSISRAKTSKQQACVS